MADNPKNNQSDDLEIKGGWSKPRSGWQQPEPKQQTGGWKRVRAMPENLSTEPTDEGAWHLPEETDTSFRPEDELEIALERLQGTGPIATSAASVSRTPAVPRPEDMFLGVTPEALAAEEAEEDDDENGADSFGGLGELIALVNLVDEPKPPELMIESQPRPEDMLGDIAAQVEAESEAVAEASVFDESLSPEWEALAQATGQPPAAEAEPAVEAEADAAADPAAYAREQIEQLQDISVDDFTPIDEADPAAYAREQVEQLGTEEPVDPEQEALAQRFIDTERQVHELREQYRNGQMTRDELQDQLRKLLILDNDQVWWMMGVDTDTWYRFDQAQNDWVPATPPRPARRGAPPTLTSELDPDQVILGSLPYLPDEPEPLTGDTEYTSDTSALDDDFIPRQVPVYDPESTVASMGAVNLDDVRRSDAVTLDGTQLHTAEPTIQAQPVGLATDAYAEGIDSQPTEFDDVDYRAPSFQQAAEKQQRSRVAQALLIGSLVIGGAFILGALFVLFVIVLPYNRIASEYSDQIIALASYEPAFQTAEILDADGNLIAELNSADGGARIPRSNLNQFAAELIHAVISVEDRRFYENPGYDPFAIVRAFVENLFAGRVVEGASTITQQIASALIIQDTSPTADNKLREIVVAAEIARQYSKNEILLLYLNEIFLGNQSYGMEAAAQFYFDKSADTLDLAESAFLAGLISAPAAFDPVTNPIAAFRRMDEALLDIADVGCLNFQHAPYVGSPFCIARSDILNAQGEFAGEILVQRAQVEAQAYLPREVTVEHPHFVYFVLAQLENLFGPDEIYRRGFRVRTTMIPRIQQTAEDALRDELRRLEFTGINTGSIMVTDPGTGAIRAMVGSPDFNNPNIDGQVNGALTWQQPASTIKPVVYAAAMDGVGDRNNNGLLDYDEYYTAATILWDVPTTFGTTPPFNPPNADGQFRGAVSVRSALANSLNVPAVKAMEFIGAQEFVTMSQALGLNFLNDPPQVTLASALGSTDVRLYDMMAAYGTLANTGAYVPLYAIIEITDVDGNLIPLPERPQPETRLTPQIAFLLQSILSDNTARSETIGPNSPLFLPEFPDAIAAKTGTSNDNRDLWTMGFSRGTVVGVWLGRADNQPTRGAGSLESAAPVWNRVMRVALEGRNTQPFTSPGDIFQEVICALTGALPGDNCAVRRNEFFAVAFPPPPADQGIVQNIPIDTWTGLRANEFCSENIQVRTFASINDQAAIQWLNSPAGQSTASALGLQMPIEAPPANGCDVNTLLPTARITSPVNGEIVQNTVQVTGAVSAQNFDRYQLEIAPAQAPNNFALLDGPYQQQFPNMGTLGEFDSNRLPNGAYILRLSVFATAQSGGGFLYRDTPITIQNIPPTPTPAPTLPPATLPPVATPTTLPFNTPFPAVVPTTIPNAGSFGVPTNPSPTATISLGG